MIEESALKRRLKKLHDRMTVGLASSVSSVETKSLPKAGCTPRIENRFHEHVTA